MKLRTFDSLSQMEREALGTLGEHLARPDCVPHAVMLSGGRTPAGLYRHLESRPIPVDGGLHLMVADERYVPVESPESNFGFMAGMVRSLGVPESNVMRVRTELPLEEAACRYDQTLAAFLNGGGAITLGFLGLGEDGHTASLFTPEDARGELGRLAMAVRPAGSLPRVSVTAELLRRVARLVFLVAGKAKRDIVQRLVKSPERVVAGLAVLGAEQVEVWYAP